MLRSQVQVCPARLRPLEAPNSAPQQACETPEEEQQGPGRDRQGRPRVHRAGPEDQLQQAHRELEKELQNVAERNHILEGFPEALQADYQALQQREAASRLPGLSGVRADGGNPAGPWQKEAALRAGERRPGTGAPSS